jgi:pimeloyl-ACP methyl ester carboxylesterase
MGLRVIAVDYRGAGASTRPVGGYDKMTMGKDLGDLVVNVLGLKKVLVLGHDIGSMVAVGMTLQFRDVVEGLMIMGESGGRSIALSRYI